MADPKDLQEAADAIHEVRGLPAVQRHKELDDPLAASGGMGQERIPKGARTERRSGYKCPWQESAQLKSRRVSDCSMERKRGIRTEL
jgi:hypothetical protein